MKNAYIFPGQGAQFSGMGKELYEASDVARTLFERANDILGFRITDIMFEGSADELRQTAVTQPAVFLHSVILGSTLGIKQAIRSANFQHSSPPAHCHLMMVCDWLQNVRQQCSVPAKSKPEQWPQ